MYNNADSGKKVEVLIWDLSSEQLQKIDLLSEDQRKRLLELFLATQKSNLESKWQQINLYDFAVSSRFIEEDTEGIELKSGKRYQGNSTSLDKTNRDWHGSNEY